MPLGALGRVPAAKAGAAALMPAAIIAATPTPPTTALAARDAGNAFRLRLNMIWNHLPFCCLPLG